MEIHPFLGIFDTLSVTTMPSMENYSLHVDLNIHHSSIKVQHPEPKETE